MRKQNPRNKTSVSLLRKNLVYVSKQLFGMFQDILTLNGFDFDRNVDAKPPGRYCLELLVLEGMSMS